MRERLVYSCVVVFALILLNNHVVPINNICFVFDCVESVCFDVHEHKRYKECLVITVKLMKVDGKENEFDAK